MKVAKATAPIASLIVAEFLSLLGNQVAAIAIPLLVLHYTNSTVVTGIAVAGNTIPFVIAAFIGGRAVDKFGAWPVSIVADVLSCISVLALPLVFILYTGNVSPYIIFMLVFAGAFFDPTGVAARHTLAPILARIGGIQLNKINAIRGGLENAADFAGPLVGVGLVSITGINNTFFANAASFMFCAIIFAIAVPKKRNRPHVTTNNKLLSGVAYVFKNSTLKTLAVTGMVAGFVISPFLGLLLVVLAAKSFNNPALFGISISAFGITATLSAAAFSKLSRLLTQSVIYYGGLITMGAGILFCGVVTAPYAVILCAAFAGLAGAGNPLEQTILQQQTPQAIAGQVFAALPAIRFAAGAAGLVFAGFITQVYSVNVVLVFGGALLMLTAVGSWVVAPLKQPAV